jgi:hypothetical protein
MRTQQILWLAPALAALLAECGCGSDSTWKHRTFAFASAADPPASVTGTNIVALGRVTISPVFQSRAFTYRTGDNTFVQDPYAAFLTAPERALAEPIRAGLRQGGAFGRVIEPGSALIPSVAIEASVTELCGDFRNPAAPAGTMEIHFIIYEVDSGQPGRVLLDKTFSRREPLAHRTPEALAAAWQTDLHVIMEEINTEYAKAHSDDRR